VVLHLEPFTNGSFNGQSVTHTNFEANAWWEVDLGLTTALGDINIFNRTNNCCINRLTNFTVSVLNESGVTTFSQSFNSAPNPSITINANGAVGSIVRVQLNENNTPLSLAEVEVFAFGSTNRSSVLDEITNVEEVSTYPNPFNNVLTVGVGIDNEIYSAEIVGTNGITYSTPVTIVGNEARLSTENLVKGIYIIKLNTSNGVITERVSKD